MNGWEILTAFGWLFCCLGMMQQQQQPDFLERWKRNTNVLYWCAVIHQRGIIVPFRTGWGTQAIGFPCLCALILMSFSYVLTHDPGMLLWMGGWFLCFMWRRIEALRLVGRVDSRYDGMPKNLGRNERLAKLIWEPLLVGVLAVMALKFYECQGWSPFGLPYFLFFGVITLPFVEAVKQTVWNNKLQAMRDGRLEQEALTRDYDDQFGH